MCDDRLIPPPVLWAQRKNLLYVKVQLEDCKEPIINLEKNKLYFKGKGGTENSDHEVTLDFLKEIKTEESRYSVKDRATEFVLIKSEEGFWKRLLKEDKKYHWLKVDFNKWKDEDDSEDEVDNNDFEQMMRRMGGMGGMGGGMGGMAGGMAGMNDSSSYLNYDQDAGPDSDDEEDKE